MDAIRTVVGASFIFLLIALCTSRSQAFDRVQQDLDQGWRFKLANVHDGQAETVDDSAWRALDLPHDWSIEGDYKQTNPAGGPGAYLPGGIAWYRREIAVPSEWIDKHVEIEFDAANRNSDVYINGHLLGHRPYGYVSFAYDLTRFIHSGKNLLAVRLDCSQVPMARWYMGCGIYSHVRLVVTDPLHVAHWGTFVTTPRVTTQSATVHVRTEITNDSDRAAAARLLCEIVDNDKSLARVESPPIHLEAHETSVQTIALQLPHPALWSPDSPHEYALITRLLDTKQSGDVSVTPFGVRSTRWDSNTGFWLNGQHIKIHGLGMHYDGGGAIGAAIPEILMQRRLIQLKAMGLNAIRTGHTPFPPYFYDLCDHLGLMVIDEFCDGWHRKAPYDYGSLYYQKWWKTDLGDIIRRDRNHPCIIAWSVGNETGESDINHMSDLVHTLDTSRATTGGELLEGIDVSGFTGKGESPGILESFHKSHPDKPILLIEETHAYETRGFYRTRTWWRDPGNVSARVSVPEYSEHEIFPTGGDPQWNSSYDNALVRMSVRQCVHRTAVTPWIAGEFKWLSYDYLGEASGYGSRHWPMRYGNPGVIDSAGFPKDIYYFLQSQYETKVPMVHLLPPWTHPELSQGTKIPVVAYSNCDEVELFLNGKSLGRQKPRAELLDFLWQVPYEPGELKAIGYRNGKSAATCSESTAGNPAQIQLTSDEAKLSEDRHDLSEIKVAISDSAGQIAPTAENRVDFKLMGPATLLGLENGNPTDVTPNKSNYRNALAGLLKAYIQPTGKAGPITLDALSVLGDTKFQDKTIIAISFATLNLRGRATATNAELHYTLDGSEPTTQSSRYDKPIEITATTTIKAAAIVNGKAFLTTTSTFVNAPPVLWNDPRFEPSAVESAAFPSGPHDSRIVGVWREGKQQFHFAADGTFSKLSDDKEQLIGKWWYTFPTDPNEDLPDAGHGGIRFDNSGDIRDIRLSDQNAKELLIKSNHRQRHLVKQPATQP